MRLSRNGGSNLVLESATCVPVLLVFRQPRPTPLKGLLKFRQNCVIAGITSASLSSIEQCVLALRSSLMADKEMLLVTYCCRMSCDTVLLSSPLCYSTKWRLGFQRFTLAMILIIALHHRIIHR